jgi:hypothetical protein
MKIDSVAPMLHLIDQATKEAQNDIGKELLSPIENKY